MSETTGPRVLGAAEAKIAYQRQRLTRRSHRDAPMSDTTCRTIATTWLIALVCGLILAFGPQLDVPFGVQLVLCLIAIVAVVGIVVAVWRVGER